VFLTLSISFFGTDDRKRLRKGLRGIILKKTWFIECIFNDSVKYNNRDTEWFYQNGIFLKKRCVFFDYFYF